MHLAIKVKASCRQRTELVRSWRRVQSTGSRVLTCYCSCNCTRHAAADNCTMQRLDPGTAILLITHWCVWNHRCKTWIIHTWMNVRSYEILYCTTMLEPWQLMQLAQSYKILQKELWHFPHVHIVIEFGNSYMTLHHRWCCNRQSLLSTPVHSGHMAQTMGQRSELI